jgi:hypothetical protein
MADEDRRGVGGGKLSRSETVTVRLDPKLRYLAELAARRSRRTLSSYVEWVIAESLNRVELSPTEDQSLADEASTLWDVDEADRFVKLAFRHPELLTHEEQVRWKLIRENGAVWKGRYAGFENEFVWTVREDSLLLNNLRLHWASFCAVADGSDEANLPAWVRKKSGATDAATKTGFDDMDDDIPF